MMCSILMRKYSDFEHTFICFYIAGFVMVSCQNYRQTAHVKRRSNPPLPT